MFKKLTVPLFVFFLVFLAGFAATEERQLAGFEALKSLEGDWVGKWEAGGTKEVTTTFRLISGGSSIVQTVQGHHGEMVTTYYPDGDHLMLTHYCNAHNQPRLRSDAPSAAYAKMITFLFKDATNMASVAEGHIEKLVITLQDSDHIRQDWTWREGDATRTDMMSFRRK